jgi:hypothetical protein
VDTPEDGLSDSPQLSAAEMVALSEASQWVGAAVVAVGLGRGADGGSAVVVHLAAGAGERPDLPEQVGGLPVEIIDSGPVQALADPDGDG